MGLGPCANPGSKLPCSLPAGLDGTRGSAFPCPSQAHPMSSSVGAAQETSEPFLEQRSLKGILGRAGLFGGAAAEDIPSLSWVRAPSPCSVPKLGNMQHHSARWCCTAAQSCTEKGWGGPKKTKQTELEQLNPSVYLLLHYLSSHSKSVLAAFVALSRASGRCPPQWSLWPWAVSAR